MASCQSTFLFMSGSRADTFKCYQPWFLFFFFKSETLLLGSALELCTILSELHKALVQWRFPRISAEQVCVIREVVDFFFHTIVSLEMACFRFWIIFRFPIMNCTTVYLPVSIKQKWRTRVLISQAFLTSFINLIFIFLRIVSVAPPWVVSSAILKFSLKKAI